MTTPTPKEAVSAAPIPQGELIAEIQRLQAALSRWLPMVPADDSEYAEQVAQDAYLLMGMEGEPPRQYGIEQAAALAASEAALAHRWECQQSLERTVQALRGDLAESQRQLAAYRGAINKIDDRVEYARTELARAEIHKILAELTAALLPNAKGATS